MTDVELRRAGAIAYREAGADAGSDRPAALCLHGFPETSYMWRPVLAALGAAGDRAVAPDLPGFGRSDPDPPGTWERQVEAVERFRGELGLRHVALVVHDWGGLIGLRWACEHRDAVTALVISDTGFFPDGKWHGMGQAIRTPGDGERLLESMTREGFGQMLGAVSTGLGEEAADEYWRSLGTDAGRRATLELYRSGDFSKLAPYQGKLAELEVPTLLVWGEEDPFAPLAGAHRLEREIPGSRLVVIDGAGHFVWDDEPERCARAVAEFLAESSD